MKKLIIGRNNACDIIIPDTSDLVSRKQAVLTYSFFGKMVIYDTSNNGTYINGQKLENGKGKQVTRKDTVNFARVADLDWNEVKDPYRNTKLYSFLCLAIILIISISLTIWFLQPKEEEIPAPEQTEILVEKGETVTTVEPVEEKQTQPQPKPKKKAKAKTNKNKKKEVTSEDVLKKEVNNNAPVIY